MKIRWPFRNKKCVISNLGDEVWLMHKGVPHKCFVFTGYTHGLDHVSIEFTEKSAIYLRSHA
jgi:hypothetical protein